MNLIVQREGGEGGAINGPLHLRNPDNQKRIIVRLSVMKASLMPRLAT